MSTFSAPPATPTAPTAAPIQRSITQTDSAAPIGQSMRPGLGGGLFSGLVGGFLGAGLFGLLFGQGLFGGMAGFASIIGLLLQVMLVVLVARLIFAWWQRRNMLMPAYAAAQPAIGHGFGGLSGMIGAANARPARETLTIAKKNLSTLRAKLTPEMVSYFSEQLAANASRGLINHVDDVKLLQGDLAEAWHEGGADYATVAMKFLLRDSIVERASGRTIEGGEQSIVTEVWTFMRARGSDWLLSAIQQRN